MSEVKCPHCEASVPVSVAAAVGNEQKFSYRVYPEHNNMMQAEAIGGQLVAMDKLMRAIAREDGGKVRTYINRIETHDDSSLEFHLVALPVVAWDEAKGKFVRKNPDTSRDRDGSLAEDAERLSPEGVAARAVTDGIAQTSPEATPHAD